MPKKDTASAVLGMLSATGSQTKPPATVPGEVAPRQTPLAEQPPPTTAVSAPDTAHVSASPQPRHDDADTPGTAPRTLRLRAETAARLRAAWLEAKRDDVLLTAQDFASTLVDDALARHRRRRAAEAS